MTFRGRRYEDDSLFAFSVYSFKLNRGSRTLSDCIEMASGYRAFRETDLTIPASRAWDRVFGKRGWGRLCGMLPVAYRSGKSDRYFYERDAINMALRVARLCHDAQIDWARKQEDEAAMRREMSGWQEARRMFRELRRTLREMKTPEAFQSPQGGSARRQTSGTS